MRKILVILLAMLVVGGCTKTNVVSPSPSPSHEEVLRDYRSQSLHDFWRKENVAFTKWLSKEVGVPVVTSVLNSWIINENNTAVLQIKVMTENSTMKAYVLVLHDGSEWMLATIAVIPGTGQSDAPTDNTDEQI